MRYATREEVEMFYPHAPSMRAVVAVKDGEAWGLAGIVQYTNHFVMVSSMRKPVPGKTCFRVARKIIEVADRLPGMVFAKAESNRSAAFLERIGFHPVQDGVYVL